MNLHSIETIVLNSLTNYSHFIIEVDQTCEQVNAYLLRKDHKFEISITHLYGSYALNISEFDMTNPDCPIKSIVLQKITTADSLKPIIDDSIPNEYL